MKLIQDLGMLYPTESSKRKSRFGLYECPTCHTTFKTHTIRVNGGHITQCRSCASSSHALSSHPLYSVWCDIKSRCYSTSCNTYHYYGGRGIQLSKEFMSFKAFFDYVTSLEGYEFQGHTLDRIDNNRDYTRGNIRWADKKTQSSNRGVNSNNTSGYTGVSWHKHQGKWCAYLTINYKPICIGYFSTKEVAIIARNTYIKEHNLPHTIQPSKEKHENT